jgi:Secretion system C-terminal sorting domain
MKKILLLNILLYSLVLNITAQSLQTYCSTTSQGTAGNFVINYTIGEMVLVATNKTNGLIITQGINQPITTIADTAFECYSKAEVKIFPTPTEGQFSLQLNFLRKGKLKVKIFDALGKQLQADEFEYTTFMTKQYNIDNYPSGTYFIQLFFTDALSNSNRKCAYTIQKTR